MPTSDTMASLVLPCIVTAAVSSIATYLLLSGTAQAHSTQRRQETTAARTDTDLTDADAIVADRTSEENKIVFVVRTDLGMTKGKIAAVSTLWPVIDGD